MFFVDIYVHTWFIFLFSFCLFSILCLLDMVGSLFLFVILFKLSEFNFCSYVSVCSELFGFTVFLFSEVGGSCLWILDVSVIVSVSCLLFVFWCISRIWRSENQQFFIIVLTLVCRLKTSAFWRNLYPSSSISSQSRVAPKIAVQCELIVFPSQCFVFAYLICGVL